MTPCFSQACTLPAAFADDVAACSEAGFQSMEVWLTKLETHLQQHSAIDTKCLLKDKAINVPAAAYQGGLLLSQGDARTSHFDQYRQRLELCEAFGIRTLLVVADFRRRPEPTDLERAVVSLTQAAQWADGFGVRLALEFRGIDSFCSSLDTAVRVVESCGESNVGVCFDVFHYYTGPSKFEDLDLLNSVNLAWVQFSDVSGTPRELAADSERILPGDGDWQLKPIVQKFKSIGYDGHISLELMNPVLWQLRPHQVAEMGWASLQRLLN